MSIDLKPLPDLGLRRLRNRYSVLLAASRRHLSPLEFSRLLGMQGKGDLWLIALPQISAHRRQMANKLSRDLECLLREMESGQFSRSSFWDASRSYGQVFGGAERN